MNSKILRAIELANEQAERVFRDDISAEEARDLMAGNCEVRMSITITALLSEGYTEMTQK